MTTRPRISVWAVGAGLVAVAFAAPLLYLAVSSLADPTTLVPELLSISTLGPLWNSLRLAASVAAVAGALGTATAWLVTRTDLRLGGMWRIAAPLPLVIPSFVGASALLAALGPGGLVADVTGISLPQLEGFWGSLIVLSVLTYPYVYLIVSARLEGLPASLEEGARLLGSRPPVVFAKVIWPQLRGGVIASSMLVFLYVMSDFGAVSLLRYDTLTRVIFAGRLFDPEGSLARALLLGLLALAAVWAGRRLRPRPTDSAAADRPPARYRLGRWRGVSVLFLLAVVGSGVMAPVIVFGYWTLRGLSSGGLGDPLRLAQPALGTVATGVIAGVLAVIVVYPVARAALSLVGRASVAVVSGTFAIPGLVLALSLSFYALRVPGSLVLYQTLPLLLGGYVIHFGAQSLSALEDGLQAVPSRLGEAASTLGAGRWRRFWTVDARIMLPSTLAGGGLVMLSTMKELPMTLLLSPPGFSTLATQVWGAAEAGFLGRVGLGSLVLIALSGLLTWMLVLRSTRLAVPYSSITQ